MIARQETLERVFVANAGVVANEGLAPKKKGAFGAAGLRVRLKADAGQQIIERLARHGKDGDLLALHQAVEQIDHRDLGLDHLLRNDPHRWIHRRATHVDVRIVAATNRNLEQEVEASRFREDLYYRLKVMEVNLPSLIERREDIPLLTDHFIQKYNRELNRHIKNADNTTMRILRNHEWKGGIRELENVIERAMVLCPGDILKVDDLPRDFRNSMLILCLVGLEGLRA